MSHEPYWITAIIWALLGAGIGFNVANLMHWRLQRSLMAVMKTHLAGLQAEHDHVVRGLIIALNEARGTEIPPELRQ